MRYLRKLAFDFALSAEVKSSEDIETEFVKLIEGFGFQSYLLTDLPSSVYDDHSNLFNKNNWDVDWYERYMKEEYYLDDPVSSWSFLSREPFYWRDAFQFYIDRPRKTRIITEASEYNFKDGLCFPIVGINSLKAVISLGTDRRYELSQVDLHFLYLACLRFASTITLSSKKMTSQATISQRESEVLKWTAAGKTAWEISKILSISSDTVNRHLGSARKKLFATNNPQAVAHAINTRQILF